MLKGPNDLGIEISTILDDAACTSTCLGYSLYKVSITTRAQTKSENTTIFSILRGTVNDFLAVSHLTICEHKDTTF